MKRARLVGALLLASCGGEGESARPVTVAPPPGPIDFGVVSVERIAERRLVFARTGASVSRTEIRGDDLGLASVEAEASTLVVAFRPCPPVHDDSGFDVCACPSSRLDAELLVWTDDTDEPLRWSLEGSSAPVGPELSLTPEPYVPMTGPVDTATITVRNAGCGALRVLDVVAEGPSIEDFAIEGCDAWPCARTESLCASGSCTEDELALVVHYANDDASLVDVVDFVVRTDAPNRPEGVVTVEGRTDPGCVPPAYQITASLDQCVGQPIELRAEEIAPGAAPITFDWEVVFAPGTYELAKNGATATLLAERDGVFAVSLEASAPCGAMATTVQTIRIAATCP